jgi:hypothetical protein
LVGFERRLLDLHLHPHPQGKVLYEGAYGHRGTTHTLKDKSFAFDAAL